MRATLLDFTNGLDEIFSVSVMFGNARSDGEDVWVEYDVLWRETYLVHEDQVGSLANTHFILQGSCLTILVEGHHHDRGAVALRHASLLLERIFTFLEAYGIDDAFALSHLQSRLDHGPFRAVDHYGDPSNVRFTRH